MRVLIIGAGIGGLACGIRLAAQGQDVTILEKNEVPGGRCHRFESGGFSFDTGPTLLMMPDTLEELFHDAGRRMQDYVKLQRINPSYRITFSDGESLDFTQELKPLEREIRKFGRNEVESFYRFLGWSETLYRRSREWFIDRPLEKPSDYAGIHALSYMVKSRPWQSVYQVASRHFRSPHLRMAFSFQTLYLGISPLDCPAIYGMLPYIDLVDGVYYPEGGMSRIAAALGRLFQDLGGTLLLNTEVEEILVKEGRAAGVLLHNERRLPAEAVVSNVDLPQTYRRFLKRQQAAARRRIGRMQKGCSAAVFLWGLDQTYPQLHHHNLYLPMDYQRTLRQIFTEDRLPDEPAFYLCAPARTDPSVAPPGCESVMALVPVPNQTNPKDWANLMPALRQQMVHVLQRTLLPGLSNHIVTEKTLPPTWYENRYGLLDASTFGLSPTFFQSAMFRPQRRASDIGDLYFVGASTHPGNGVPIVLISAKFAAGAILETVENSPRASRPLTRSSRP